MSWINKVSTIASKIFVLSSSEPTSNTHVEMRKLVDDWNLCFFSGKKEVKSVALSKPFPRKCKKVKVIFSIYLQIQINILIYHINLNAFMISGLKKFGACLYHAPYVHQTSFWGVQNIMCEKILCSNHY